MVFPESEDETDDEHISNTEEDSGLALFFSKEMGGKDGGRNER